MHKLIYRKDPRGMTAIRILARDPESPYRELAIGYLGKLGSEKDVEYLKTLINSNQVNLISLAMTSLTQFDEEAMPGIQLSEEASGFYHLLDHEDPEIRKNALPLINKILRYQKSESYTKVLLQAAQKEKNEEVLFSLIDDLQKQVVTQEAVDFMGALLLNHKNRYIRKRAADYLAKTLKFGSSGYLNRGLKDSSYDVVSRVMRILVDRKDLEGMASIRSMAYEAESPYQRIAISFLGEMGSDEDVEYLKTLIDSDQENLIVQAMKSLGEYDEKLATPLLKEMLFHENRKIRENALACLHAMDSTSSMQIILSLYTLKDKIDGVVKKSFRTRFDQGFFMENLSLKEGLDLLWMSDRSDNEWAEDEIWNTHDIKNLEEIAVSAITHNEVVSRQYRNRAKTLAFARLGAMGTDESIRAVQRIEHEGAMSRPISRFASNAFLPHPVWHVGGLGSWPRIIASATSSSGIKYEILFSNMMGRRSLFLTSQKTAEGKSGGYNSMLSGWGSQKNIDRSC